MVSSKPSSQESFWQEDPFGILKPGDFTDLGIDVTDIPQGTLAATRHPPLLSSRFGGNAYGFGFFEIYDHLSAEDFKFLQSLDFDNPGLLKRHYKKLNRIYKRIGLLIRFSSLGRPYYLIPAHLVASSIANIKNKSDEISKIIHYHRKKYLKESHKIGVLTHDNDPIINDLSLRFKEHRFITIDSPEKLHSLDEILDLVILTRDIYRTILLEKLRHRSSEMLTLRQLEKHALYMLGNIYRILKPDGEIFIIANHRPLKTNRTTEIEFKSMREKKYFLIFTHIFKTRKRYGIKDPIFHVNMFDLERYLRLRYVEHHVMDRLLKGKDPEKMSIKEINGLPYLDLPLDTELHYDQQKVWPRLTSIYFNGIFQKFLIPDSVKSERHNRFSISDNAIPYFLVHLAQKKALDVTFPSLKKDILESHLVGCPLPLVAEYRNSFDYVIRTLNVLNNIKKNNYQGLPEIFMERLSEPMENRRRRYGGLNNVLKLMSKTKKLKKMESYFNPDMIEGPRTGVLENIEFLRFFGFGYEELREIFLIITGHSAMGRILSGKMNERALNPVSDLARKCEPYDALNLLRYCRLMSMAETVASRRADMNPYQLTKLFDLYDSMVRVVTNREMDWDRLMDEKISSIGGIHNQLIQKLLMMMNHFEFFDNWAELRDKGEMEKESLADYDAGKLDRIENIIGLVKIVELFENKFLRDDPLQLPMVYRKFLNMEFHGTGHIFELMDAQLVFVLLWFAVNVTRGGIINFNPITADIDYSDTNSRIKKVEEEAMAINRDYLDLNTLRKFSDQLYEKHSAFISNTGFQLIFNTRTQAVDIHYIDMDENIRRLGALAKRYTGYKISDIAVDDLEEMERLFANLESFYRGHLRFVSDGSPDFKVPERQIRWFKKARDLRQYLSSKLLHTILEPGNIYSDLDLLYHHGRSLLYFALPESAALNDVSLSGRIYWKSPVFEHVLTSTKKIQSLIRGDLKDFQDNQTLHKLAQREFGPLASGIVGFNESQVETLKSTLRHIRPNRPLFDALIKAVIFQDIGLAPALREKYRGEINLADQGRAGALLLKREKIPQRYNMDPDAEQYLTFLVEHDDWLHHLVRGEYSLHALQEITDRSDKGLFDAFFISSIIMFSALGEDLIMEDLAANLFEMRNLCTRIMEGETDFEHYFNELYTQKGHLFHALEEFQKKGLPEGTTPWAYMKSWKGDSSSAGRIMKAGKLIHAMERIFRLRGIRYVDFSDLANLIVKVPLKFIFQKRNYSGIGYATFEKELFEALRMYNGIKRLPEAARHFMLERLDGDRVRIFGFENISIYLNYENQIKLLLIVLLGSLTYKGERGPIFLSFIPLFDKIDKRYEAINDFLSNIPVERIWEERDIVQDLFRAKTGLVLENDPKNKVLEVNFTDRINISQKISHMGKIGDLEQLKNYYHTSLQSLRKNPFYTDDYERKLEEVFYQRLGEITDRILEQAKKQMDLLKDFKELHHFYTDLMDRALEAGFSEDQNHRLTDLYELRKDILRSEKLDEINSLLDRIHDINELKDYWDSIKWYLVNNRQYIGREFETLIANNFDKCVKKIRDMSFQVHFMS